MANRDEIRVLQTTNYYQLLMLKHMNEKKGIKVEGLKTIIGVAKAAMTEPDIAWVEKQVSEACED